MYGQNQHVGNFRVGVGGQMEQLQNMQQMMMPMMPPQVITPVGIFW